MTGAVSIGNTLFFAGTDEEHGSELWRTDGTVAGTKMVKDLVPDIGSSQPHYFIVYDNKIYFSASDASFQSALWRSDGTASGTKRLRNVAVNSMLGIANGKLFFNGYTDEKGIELWVTDGTGLGTRLVKDIYPGSNFSFPSLAVETDSLLYFFANDGVHGPELWRSNGFITGTKLVKDITPGYNGSSVFNMVKGNGRLYFIRDDKLWSSDGTANGTAPVNNPDLINASQLSLLLPVKNKIFFTAYTPEKGNELYAINAEDIGIRPPEVENMLKAPVAENFINIYPNPTISKATVTIPGKLKDVTITLADVSGKVLWQGNYRDQKSVKLPTENLAAGVYMITIRSGDETKTAKLVKE